MNRGFGAVAGKVLTYALSAPVMAIAVIALAALTVIPVTWANLLWAVVAAFFLGVFPLAGYVVPALAWRRAEKAVRNHIQRVVSFATNLVSYPIGALILFLGQAPTVLTAIAASYVTTVVVLALVNLFYRASGHASGVAGPVVAFFALYGLWALPSLLLLPLVVWARVRVKGHTWAQTVVGGLIGAFAAWACFSLIL